VSTENRLRIAVFIDFDNIEIGVKNTLGASFDAGLVLEALKERGEVVSKTAYSDWQRAGGYSRALTQHAIRMVQRNLTPGGDKNGADINLALDALEMAFTHPHINAFVIVGGDSDFISLVEKLKQYDKKVFVVGGRGFTSQILQRNCNEFIAYENLSGAGNGVAASGPRRASGRDAKDARAATDIEQAIPLVNRALKVLADREVSPQLGLLKSTLLQLDSTFSERTYGASTFRDFAQKLERAGVLKVIQTKGGWIVAPNDGSAPASDLASADDRLPAPADSAPPPRAGDITTTPSVTGTAADGVRELAAILSSGIVRRWPLYLRNVKQILRQANAGFDERAYGFAGLVDLLRAAHKEGIVRVERDRQGVVRVFQGSGVAAPPAADDSAADDQMAMLGDASMSSSSSPVVPELEDAPRAAAPNAPAHAIGLIEAIEPLEPPDDQLTVLGPAIHAEDPGRPRAGRRPRGATTPAKAPARRPKPRRAS
jgi:uncharacterized LabA/DUF88 family protein